MGDIKTNVEEYHWNGYRIVGDKHELDELIKSLEDNGINKYDVLNTLSLDGCNCVASSGGAEFVTSLRNAFDNLLLRKAKKLLLIIRCGCKSPTMSEMTWIYAVLSDAGLLNTSMVKFDIFRDKGLGNFFKVYIVASYDDSEFQTSSSTLC